MKRANFQVYYGVSGARNGFPGARNGFPGPRKYGSTGLGRADPLGWSNRLATWRRLIGRRLGEDTRCVSRAREVPPHPRDACRARVGRHSPMRQGGSEGLAPPLTKGPRGAIPWIWARRGLPPRGTVIERADSGTRKPGPLTLYKYPPKPFGSLQSLFLCRFHPFLVLSLSLACLLPLPRI